MGDIKVRCFGDGAKCYFLRLLLDFVECRINMELIVQCVKFTVKILRSILLDCHCDPYQEESRNLKMCFPGLEIFWKVMKYHSWK